MVIVGNGAKNTLTAKNGKLIFLLFSKLRNSLHICMVGMAICKNNYVRTYRKNLFIDFHLTVKRVIYKRKRISKVRVNHYLSFTGNKEQATLTQP